MKPTDETFDPLTARKIELCGDYFADCNLLADVIAQDMKAYEELEQQRNELAAVLVEVNEFCQKRGIGKVGDSASVALMQRYDELAAQVERLRGEIVAIMDDSKCTGCIVTRHTSGYQPCEKHPTTGAPGDE